MASLWFIELVFKCLHHIAWPLVALVYPLCATIQAIETDSFAEFKDLISYWRKCFVEKYNFLMNVERYMKENGTEALEKLIASKNTMCRTDADAINEIVATENNEMLKTNGERLHMEHRDIKDLEAIEKKEIPATKQNTMGRPDAEGTNDIIDTENKEMLKTNGETLQIEHKDIKGSVAIEKKEIPATKQRTCADTVASQNASSATVEPKGIVGRDTVGGEVPRSSSKPKEVQKEWTCALCLETTWTKTALTSHLNGSEHMANCDVALNAINMYEQHFRVIKSKIICTVCSDVISSEEYMASHVIGKKHLSKIESW